MIVGVPALQNIISTCSVVLRSDLLQILLGGIINVESLTSRNVNSLGGSFAEHLVDQTNVGEGTANHDFIIASTGTIAVEVILLHTSGFQVAGSRRALGNVTSRTDVIGGDRVAEVQQAVGILDGGERRGLDLHGLEERRVVDVSGSRVPFVQLGLAGLQSVPLSSTLLLEAKRLC